MNLDDPRLTAYALGELNPEERRAMEEELTHSPEGRAVVEETAAFAQLLREEFHAAEPERLPGESSRLTPEQREQVLREASLPSISSPRFTPGRIIRFAGIAAIAAALVILPCWSLFKSTQRGTASRELAALAPTSGKDVQPLITEAQQPEAPAPITPATERLLAAKMSGAPVAGAPSSTPMIVAVAKPDDKAATTAPVEASALLADTANLKSPAEEQQLAAKTPGSPIAAASSSQPMIVADAKPVARAAPVAPVDSPTSMSPTAKAPLVKASPLWADAPKLATLGETDQKEAGAGFAFAGGDATGAADKIAGGKTMHGANTYTGTFTISSGNLSITAQPQSEAGGVAMAGAAQAAPGNGVVDHAFIDSQKSTRVSAAPVFAARLRSAAPFDSEAYSPISENSFHEVAQTPLSTFSTDVDTASYSNVRRFLTGGRLPPLDAVRIEELINYFHYDYPQPHGDAPISVNTEVAECPWASEHRLVRVAMAGRAIPETGRPPCNLVFLLDVSGSMEDENKLPLLKQCMRLLLQQLGESDRVSIVTYAGESGVALQTVRGDQKEKIREVLDRLRAGGSTNGGQGIQMAYDTATHALISNGVNRVILATDGDFNVGVTNESDLVRLVEEKAKKTGVFLTVLGVGEGNLKDSIMKKLASHGHGNYAYIDSVREGYKVLVDQLGGTLVTVASDAKIQVEFNPRFVDSYRLIGYENRLLRKQDFNNDEKDAGSIGSGHTVTALYEVVPTDGQASGSVDPLKYQPKPAPASTDNAVTSEMLTVKLRYKKPGAETSILMEQPVKDDGIKLAQSSADLRFAAAVAEFGMLLRHSPQAGSATWESARDLAEGALGRDTGGSRAEFLDLLEKAKKLQGN